MDLHPYNTERHNTTFHNKELDVMTIDNRIRNTRVMELTMNDEIRSTRAKNTRDNEIDDGRKNSRTMK